MKDRNDIRDDHDDLDERRENGTNGIDHKSSYSLCIRSTNPRLTPLKAATSTLHHQPTTSSTLPSK